MNYHRVVVQLLSLGISVAEFNGESFSDMVYEKAYKSVNFLYQCAQNETGHLPNYGSNDGAWFFPLSDTDYRDFRPQLNALHQLLTGKSLYKETEVIEEANWMKASESSIINKFPPIEKKMGVMEFPFGGYYLIHEQDTFTFIKCGQYKDRPAQADNLHMDVWHKGENLLFDAGSYKYNTDEEMVKYFAGTESHNTVMLDEHDQMLKGPRFIWLNWSQAITAKLKENATEYQFSGAVKCFTYLDKNIVHKRTVTKKKGQPVWIVKDEILHKPDSLILRQLWHTSGNNIDFHSEENKYIVKQGWRSLYYGKKEAIKQIEFSTNKNKIETIIRLT